MISTKSTEKRHKIIVVTPASRQRYLEILATYILQDNFIDEWYLWDNCRKKEDRAYINKLANSYPKVHVVNEPGVDGTNKSINKFFKHARDPDAFYIRLDDDIVYLP